MQFDISIAPNKQIAKVFRLLKRFEPSIELGSTIQAIRDGLPVLSREGVGTHSEEGLKEVLALIDALNEEAIQFTLTIVELHPVATINERPASVRREATRDDVLNLLEKAVELAREQRSRAEKTQAWMGSEEGKQFVATQQQLSVVRIAFESRWERLGYEQLTEYERDYLNVWWLCVEVDTGGFHQYFFNSYSDTALATLSSLESIGAPMAHSVLVKSLSIFDEVDGFQTERTMRWKCLEALPDDAFQDVTQRFYELEEDLRSLALSYVEQGYARDMISIVRQESDSPPD